MTNKKIIDLLTKVIDGRKGVSIQQTGEGCYRLYNDCGTFAAVFISDAIRLAADYFIGITVDKEGKAYMLFVF